ncbi:hypothetical protein ACS0TY_018035 [Phlomoides rotata]
MMRKQISYVNLIEVAPAPLISHHKASNAPKLETIVEEGFEKMDVSSKRVLYALPIILSLLSYLLINRVIKGFQQHIGVKEIEAIFGIS